VSELVFAVNRLEAQVHAARLVVGEVRATGHFQIGVLSWRPHLNVIGLRRAEADVARAKLDDCVVQSSN